MEKVVFNQLTIEVTRRCNMACAHCLRGDIANGIARRGIALMRMQVITNGLIYEEGLVTLAKRFSEITRLTQVHGYGNTAQEQWRVSVGVSFNRYHEAPEICKKHYLSYKNALKGFAEVLQVRHGNAPRNVGRAAALADTINYTLTAESYMLQQIEVLSADRKPMCKFYESYHLERPDQKVICCGIYLNAWGEVLPGLACDTDYQCKGIRICYAWEPLWEKLLEYNQEHDRQHCTYFDDLRTKITLMRDRAQVDKEYALFANPAAQDEPSAEPMYIRDIRRYRAQMAKWTMPDNCQELERKASEKNYLPV